VIFVAYSPLRAVMGVDVGRNNPICTGQLRSHTDEYVRLASAAETLYVVRRGRLVARIESLMADRAVGRKPPGTAARRSSRPG